MCDYSLQNVASRPANVGDKLASRNFGRGTSGFAASEDSKLAVCVLPGTELAFSDEIGIKKDGFFRPWSLKTGYRTAIFRQVNKDQPYRHHDALELPNGEIILLTMLSEGQEATVLQLPAEPKTPAEKEAQTRVAYAG
jgi:hypothetical protein